MLVMDQTADVELFKDISILTSLSFIKCLLISQTLNPLKDVGFLQHWLPSCSLHCYNFSNALFQKHLIISCHSINPTHPWPSQFSFSHISVYLWLNLGSLLTRPLKPANFNSVNYIPIFIEATSFIIVYCLQS